MLLLGMEETTNLLPTKSHMEDKTMDTCNNCGKEFQVADCPAGFCSLECAETYFQRWDDSFGKGN